MSRRRYIMLLLGLGMVLLMLVPLLMLPGSISKTTEGKEWSWSPDTVQSEEPRNRSIDVIVSMSEIELAELDQLNDRFQSAHPGAEVRIHNMPREELYDRLKREAALDELPDILLLESEWVQEFAARGYLDPVDDLYSAESLADHPASLLQQVRWNGYLWGVPLHPDPNVIVWSRSLLEDAGAKEAPTDWERLSTLIGATREAAGEGPAPLWLAGASSGEPLMTWLAALHTGSAATARQALTLPDGLWAWLESGVAEGRIELAESDPLALAELLSSGRLLSAVMTWSDYQLVSSRLGAGQLQLSLPEGGLLSPGGRSWVIADRSAEQELAHDWVAAAVSLDAQREALARRTTIPARLSLYAGSASGQERTIPVWLEQALSVPALMPSGPDWYARMAAYESLWQRWQAGELTAAAYREGWEARLPSS
ncbi:hypothetical protein PA598K_03868 [Paenibacillus sp. 598K]|uniref:ABC transporter substrate-binding protein n=1 Tax=Paenibacillus sp. 598K TaxID=1117987 RepID=UPI000FFAEDF5|nr:extracellular solute-binding protein [Paenibacillus sp. 598K]GBF75455.1 hypothetical protein PA598K_03868 [Paenibacillus sp. 598K]